MPQQMRAEVCKILINMSLSHTLLDVQQYLRQPTAISCKDMADPGQTRFAYTVFSRTKSFRLCLKAVETWRLNHFE